MAKDREQQQESPKSPGQKFSALVESAKGRAAQSWQEFRIGDGHAAGMGRKGAVELGQYLPAFNTAGTHTVEDQGVFPNQTQGEIARGRGETGLDVEEERTASTGPAPTQPEQTSARRASVLGYDLPAQELGSQQSRHQSRGR